jgi:DNA-binding LytR/AlgR family response regulator
MHNFLAWLLKPFPLLESHKSRWQLVLFCGVFGFLFLNIFEPFHIRSWFEEVNTSLFFTLTFFSAAGTTVLALTQFVIRSLLNIQLTSRVRFIFWVFFEFFLISIAVHAVNHIITKHHFLDVTEYLQTLKYTLLVMVLPYFLAILLLYVHEQLQVVEELTLKANRPINIENININDENGKVAMSLTSKNIVYFKSEDNYILLYYKAENQLKKELIRTNLKKLEQELNQPNFIRIHRSYMINSQNLASAVKTSRGYQLKMDLAAEVPLPVSGTYQKEFENLLIQKG